MKKALFFMLSLLAFAACEAELDSIYRNQSMATKEVGKSNNIISADDAAKMALEFRKSLLAENGMTRSAANAGGVSSVYAWRSRDVSPKNFTRSSVADVLPDTLLYIVNFEQNSGYALVSATKELPGVVAYIEEGALTPDDEIDNPGFLEFLENYEESYASMRDSIGRHHVDSIIAIVAGRGGCDSIIFRDSVLPQWPLYQFEEYVAPLLATKWDQKSPYNWCCPILDPNSNYHMPAGCTAIAVAQVLAYYQTPGSYNGHVYDWDAILQDSTVSTSNTAGANSVAGLVHDIGMMIHTSYGQYQSGALFYDIKYSLDTLGYHYNYEWDFNCIPIKPVESNFDTIKEDINNGHPVLMSGYNAENNYLNVTYGHAWVIDGIAVKCSYKIATIYNPDGSIGTIIGRYAKEYVHCNWGDCGKYDGWFKFKAFDTMWNINNDTEIQIVPPITQQQAMYGCMNFHNIAFHQVFPNP
jgi:hypothetical protein